MSDTPGGPGGGALAERFGFDAEPLGPADRPGERRVRQVAPAYAGVDAWASSAGAAVALFDADGAVTSDDVCLVDPRRDTVTVSPAPGTVERYPSFTLAAPRLLPYEVPTGCMPADLNQDGWQDLVVYYWGRSPSLFVRLPKAALSAGAYEHRELTAVPEVWSTSAATMGDYDGDGRLDLIFGNYFPDGARVFDPAGRQDDLVMPGSMASARDGGAERLFLGDGTGGFTEVSGAFAPVSTTGWTMALGTQDLDGDGRPDLYIADDAGPDKLLMNVSAPGRVAFREVKGARRAGTPGSRVLGGDSYKGMGVAFGDLNRDRVPDILVGNGADQGNFAFVSTRGQLPYDDRAEELGLSRTGWSWDVKTADFDNDGGDEIVHATGFLPGAADRRPQWQEAAMANDLLVRRPGLWPRLAPGDDLWGHTGRTGRTGGTATSLFTKDPGGHYVDVAAKAGMTTDAAGRALAVGDVDDDGRLDFALANQWGRSAFFRNTGTTAPFVGLRLRLSAGGCRKPPIRAATTRPAIGAAATLTLPDGTTSTRQLYPAGGHGGVSAPELLFGLGGAGRVKNLSSRMSLPVTVKWRDACGVPRTTSTSITPGWHKVLLTGDGRAVEMT
ncbi:CRTAC1 family protein [Sinosporangium siamense]|uniref:CRTAC1 family protein n=1 Tax=Sinosporangium siamense TaxID=1367973 RepID=UPI001951E33A|nr:CRTAC1 family protein [Sinosporangium siamense]